jgi:uncharacterized protein YyaL (SSP411 family)
MKEQDDRLAVAAVSLYDEDFFLWSQRTAEALRAGQVEAADLPHVAEEIEDLGKRDLKEINSRMQVLIAHLLKWRLQPERRSASWESTIVTQRVEIEALLKQSPSLRRTLALELADNYARAVRRAMPETRLLRNQFPAECPFALAQILDQDYLPD